MHDPHGYRTERILKARHDRLVKEGKISRSISMYIPAPKNTKEKNNGKS
jgi:hypothetical protein